MKISSIELRGFKRFSDIIIDNIPETAKLVVIAGPNGCGKSSLFDALKVWHQRWTGQGFNWQLDYHLKQGMQVPSEAANSIKVNLHGEEVVNLQERKKALYVRTAYRNDPQFRLDSLQKTGSQLDEHRFSYLFENDAAVSKNYQRLASQAFKDIFVDYNETATIAEFRQHVVGNIRTSLTNVFPDLKLNDLGNPLEDGTFYFAKGVSTKFDYKNLSGGEKSAFDLILDMVVKSKDYDNTIFCIDEPELHMNSKLQGALLGELVRLLGGNSQLWIATHSIGMLRKARDLAATSPQEVVFLDFGGRDFDARQIIEPVTPNRLFWEKVLNVALDDLSLLVAPKKVVVCEGVPRGTGTGPNIAHDPECLNTIFAEEFPDVKFLAGGNSQQVVNNTHALIGAIQSVSSGVEVMRIIDRDDHSPQDIAAFQKNGVKVLSRRHLESYLFDDEVLEHLCMSANRLADIDEVLAAKEAAIQTCISQGKPRDDIKSASGLIYVQTKRILQLTACGNDSKAFMRVKLAPLLSPGMTAYESLKADIFS